MLNQIINKPCANCDGEGQTPSKAYLKWYNCPEKYKEEFNKSCHIKQYEVCKGSGDRPYCHGEKERFYLLANRWEKETCFSSKIEIDHPCFIEMKKMKSRESIGWVLTSLHQEKSWLLISLLDIWVDKKDNPTTNDMAGNLNELTEAMVAMGEKKNNIMKEVTLYSDGACSGNPGPGGYGAMFVFKDTSRCASKGYELTTNNRMELLGIIEPLESLDEEYKINIITDSQYVANAINQNWIKSWIKNGWKTSSKKPVKNQDLWNRFLHLMNKHTIAIQWVRGHDGHSENEHCDTLAVKARQGTKLHKDMGYEK